MKLFSYLDIAHIARSARIFTILLLNVWIGLLGLQFFFANFAPGESASRRILFIGIFYAVGSLLTGFLEPRYWKFAIISSWGAVTIGIVAVVQNWGQWNELSKSILFLSILPLTVLGGFIGASMRQPRQTITR
jgi:hypothetical protein